MEEYDMDCPYCNRYMKKGHIKSTYGLARWYAEGEKPKLLPQNSGIRLSKSPATQTQVIESHYCENCKKIIIDLPD